MNKNVLILSGSPRKGGNSDLLCDEFLRGALEAGNQAEKIFIRGKKIAPCSACYYCKDHGGACAIKDDMAEILDKMQAADVIVMASPVYREQIKENIDYDLLQHDYPHRMERIDGYVELMAETCCTGRETVRVNGENMPAAMVWDRLLKLAREHICYVMDAMDRNTTQIGNIRAYTLSALYNAPTTMEQYYASMVSHDLAEE